jgi:hypothetical protein
VIGLLNDYFVPIYLRNQDFSENNGTASMAEKSKKNGIYRAALEAGLPAGTVCVYLLSPELQPLDTAPLNKPEACNPERMTEKLLSVVRKLSVPKGNPVVRPKAQSVPKTNGEDAVLFHLTARYLEPAGKEFVPLNTTLTLGTPKAGNWGDLPSEAWVELDRAEWHRLLPVGEVRAGVSWELDKDASAKLLRHFFPPTENTDVENNRLDEQSLRAQIVSVENGVARALLEGRLKMKHPFYHRDDKNFVDATLMGYLEVDLKARRLRSFRLVTDHAKYGGQHFGVALQLITHRPG